MAASTTGLVLSGGGARAAYQAGVLRAIGEIVGDAKCPFGIFTGESAGAINACFIASQVDQFAAGTITLWKQWENIQTDQVFHSSPTKLLANALRWVRDLGGGGLLGQRRSIYLLDSTPLRAFLERNIDFGKISKLVESGNVRGVAVSATNYATGSAVTFYESGAGVKPWARSQRVGRPARITLEHVLASAAIPVVFSPVRIGRTYYGDGSMRLRAPLSPVIHLGADKVLAIGSRFHRSPERTLELNQSQRMLSISLADIAGVLLNAGFLENLESDIERAERINNTLKWCDPKNVGVFPVGLRPIPIMNIRPSRDLGVLAAEQFKKLGHTLRYLMRGLGVAHRSGWDLMSYLAFESAYTKKLLDLGYADGMDREKDLRKFLDL